MNITKTSVIMATKDNDEAMGKFYKDILGFTPNENGGWDKGNISVFFDRHSQAAVQALEPSRVMLTFSVDNIDEAHNELKTKGVEFVRTPAKEEWGGKFATFKDPDGNYLQIFSF